MAHAFFFLFIYFYHFWFQFLSSSPEKFQLPNNENILKMFPMLIFVLDAVKKNLHFGDFFKVLLYVLIQNMIILYNNLWEKFIYVLLKSFLLLPYYILNCQVLKKKVKDMR